jgi:ribosomal protein S12 methylthiotransferase accessory factor
VANVTGLDHIGIPVVAVYRPNARSLSVSQGKGATLEAARASGLMEAVELHHAERVTRPLVWGSHAAVGRSRRVVDVERLPRPRGSTFTTRRVIPWIEARELIGGDPVWVPFEMVHQDLRVPAPRGSGAFASDTNGLASGNDRLEAIVHGLCEVIERDATTLWFHAEQEPAGRLDLDSVDDPTCRLLLDRYAAANVAVAVWETTTDIGVPAFLCQIADEPTSRRRPVSGAHGMGCHPARGIALSRALTEAAQCRLTWISGSRDDARAEDYDAGPEALAREREDMAVRGPLRAFRDVPTFEAPTLEEDLAWLLARLKAAALEDAAWVDLTEPQLGIPVVKVIVPGLEPIGYGAAHAAYRPGPRARARR